MPRSQANGARRPRLRACAAIVAIALGAQARPADADAPIKLVWSEGDVAGTTMIYAPGGGAPIGFVKYRQVRKGDLLSTVRIAHFRDGSSDEDSAEATVSGELRALRGRSIIRDARGESIVDVVIDVENGRLTGSWGQGADRQTIDERVDLPPNTYWGALVFIALKNFEANAVGDRLVFRTVVPTPRPRVIDLELRREGPVSIDRLGTRLAATEISLKPTLHWLVDPLVHAIAPATSFYLLAGDPPALARFIGPRNYAGEEILLE